MENKLKWKGRVSTIDLLCKDIVDFIFKIAVAIAYDKFYCTIAFVNLA
jgi:hypothetical protein